MGVERERLKSKKKNDKLRKIPSKATHENERKMCSRFF